MKRITYLLLLLGIAVLGHAQDDLFPRYRGQLPHQEPDPALRQISKIGRIYKITDKYTGGKLASIKYSEEIPLTMSFPETGKTTEFYPNGKLKRSRDPEGDHSRVKEYFANGEPYREYLEKKEETEMVTVWDTEGNIAVQQGNGRAVEMNRYEDRVFLESGSYENGRRTGEWSGFDGRPYFTESYKTGRLVSGESLDENGKKFSYKIKTEPAAFKGGEQQLYSFLGKNINMPGEITAGETRVVTRFTISTEGTVDSLQALNEAPSWAVQEAFRVVKMTSGKWLPGKLHGQPVKMLYTLPIAFVLNN